MHKTLFFPALCAATFSTASLAGGGMTGGSTEWTQLANNVELGSIMGQEASQSVTQANILAQEIVAVQTQLSQLAELYKHGVPISAWPTVQNSLTQLADITGRAQGVSYTTGNSLASIESHYGNGTAISGYGQRLTDWNTTTRSQVSSALDQFGVNHNAANSRSQALATIQNSSRTATSRLAALQAGNEISGMMVHQIQDLQGTIHAAETVKMNEIARQNAKEEQDRLQRKRFFRAPVGGF